MLYSYCLCMGGNILLLPYNFYYCLVCKEAKLRQTWFCLPYVTSILPRCTPCQYKSIFLLHFYFPSVCVTI